MHFLLRKILVKAFSEKKQANPSSGNNFQIQKKSSQVDRQSIKNILFSASAKGKLNIANSEDPSEKQADSIAASALYDSDNNNSIMSGLLPQSTGNSIDLGFESKGSQLDIANKSFFEGKYGQSLGQVRLHTGYEASEASAAVDAKAFTVGNDIYFGKNKYSPNTPSGKELLAHELVHTLQPQSKPTIRKWNGAEHKKFGDIAGDRLSKNKQSLIDSVVAMNSDASANDIGLSNDEGFSITFRHQRGRNNKVTPTNRSLGWATKMAGDHRTSAVSLDQNNFGALTYILLASSNWSHFFPLAEKEWRAHHKKAKDKAIQAHKHLTDNELDKAKESMHLAITNEAFGLHFLQDTFASGHQYPRAFDCVFDGDKGRPQTYHDILCDLKDGIDMRYSRAPNQKFHGDNLADAKDEEVVGQETFNSIAEIFCAAAGVTPSTVGAEAPMPNPGPNIPEIMKDPAAGPIWYVMEEDIKKFTSEDVDSANVETSSGMVNESHSSIMNSWRAAHTDDSTGKVLTTAQTLALGEQVNPKLRPLLRAILLSPGLNKSDVDDDIMTLITNSNGEIDVHLLLSYNLPLGILTNFIRNLLSGESVLDGACTNDEELALIDILRLQNNSDFCTIVGDIGLNVFDASIQGDNWDYFLYLCTLKASKSENFGAKKIKKDKNDDAARMLTKVGSWEGRLYYPVPYENLMISDWIGIIRALLSGSCGDDDEDAIIVIISNVVKNKSDATELARAISKSEMDSGVDGSQWDTVYALMGGYW